MNYSHEIFIELFKWLLKGVSPSQIDNTSYQTRSILSRILLNCFGNTEQMFTAKHRQKTTLEMNYLNHSSVQLFHSSSQNLNHETFSEYFTIKDETKQT